jgi:arginase
MGKNSGRESSRELSMAGKFGRIRLIGVPLDLGAGRRGVDMGPSALRIAGVGEQITRLGHEVVDEGDIAVAAPEVQRIEDPRLKYLPEIVRAVTILAQRVERALEAGDFPLVLGGDHSMAIGTISGIGAHFKKKERRVGLIWFDAHGDANTPETTESGNIHGMPLAVVFGRGARPLVEVGGFGDGEPRLRPENAVLIGVRSVDGRERAILREIGVTVLSMENLDRDGVFRSMSRALAIASDGTDAFHVSFDVDSLDPSEAPGVGTPSRGGLSYREAHTMMEMIAETGKICSMEVAEVNPILDVKNSTAEVAAELVASALGKRIL